MLTGKRITIVEKSVVNEVEIARFTATIEGASEVSFAHQHLDKEACKANRDTVRADQAAFEDFAYSIQDLISKTK